MTRLNRNMINDRFHLIYMTIVIVLIIIVAVLGLIIALA